MTDVALARDLADAVLLAAGRPRRVLAPPGPGAASRVRADCALRAGPSARVRMRLRFLHVQARRVEPDGVPDGSGVALHAGDEAVPEELDPEYALADLLAAERTLARVVPARRMVEPLLRGRVVRSRWPIHVLMRTRASGGEGGGVTRLIVEVRNVTDWPHSLGPDEALRRSLLVPHLIVALDGGVFVRTGDAPTAGNGIPSQPSAPGAPGEPTGEAIRRDVLWPVVVADDLLLASPVPLPDRPGTPIAG
ncbi:hypothetical protein [Actinomadura rupiterrae]|uniref:hypothetical protein n=1 Tax=Actinomadura rupiterrae TaxID=559627 RepID=UPI0020A40B42|nr:hypothetical protein [Actinomadura rupiterrae]MCP2339379.1 hypothetical protein [Actinomadura rupiterrae]